MQSQPRLLRLPVVLDKVGLGRSRLYELVKAGIFPAPIKISDRAVRWPEDRVDHWIAERIAASDKAAA